MLDAQKTDQIHSLFPHLKEEVELHISNITDENGLGDMLEQLAMDLASNSDKVSVHHTQSGHDLPTLEIVGKLGRGVFYSARPVDGEWQPFLDAILIAGQADGYALEENLISKLPEVTNHTQMEVYVMTACPHCPTAVSWITKIAFTLENVSAWIIDASLYMERAASQGVRATPTILIDDQVMAVGATGFDTVAGMLSAGAGQSAAKVRALIDDNKLDALVALALTDELAATAVVRLLNEPEVSLHMGVLRVIEMAMEQEKTGCDGMIPTLLGLLDSDNPQTRGDAIYALGLIGAKSALEDIKMCLEDTDEDVRETAEEAIEMIQEK